MNRTKPRLTDLCGDENGSLLPGIALVCENDESITVYSVDGDIIDHAGVLQEVPHTWKERVVARKDFEGIELISETDAVGCARAEDSNRQPMPIKERTGTLLDLLLDEDRRTFADNYTLVHEDDGSISLICVSTEEYITDVTTWEALPAAWREFVVSAADC